MKLYIKSAVYDPRGEEMAKAKKADKIATRDADIRKLVEQGISKSKLAGHRITNLEIDPPDIYFSLDGVMTYSKQPDTIHTSFNKNLSTLPEYVKHAIDSKYEFGWIFTDDEMLELDKYQDQVYEYFNQIISEIESTYDAEIDFETKGIMQREYNRNNSITLYVNIRRFLGLECDNITFRYKGYYVVEDIGSDYLYWNLGESFESNRDRILGTYEQLADVIQRWKQIVDDIDTEKVADDLEYQLKSFESKYTSRFPGLEISDLEVEPIVPTTSDRIRKALDEKYKFSFSLKAYNGEIDIQVTLTFLDLKDRTLEDRLLSLLKYRKRKYGLR